MSEARARRTDPATSHDAARGVERSGKGSSQRAVCIQGLEEHPNSTPYELAAFMGIDGIVPGKRLPELQERGLAEPGEPRMCRVRGSKARPWRRTNPRAMPPAPQGELFDE